jgi:hypothetical protein
MYIGIKDAVAIYARVCRARFGPLARRVVTEQARTLMTNGDVNGAKVWEQVADEIEKTESRVPGDKRAVIRQGGPAGQGEGLSSCQP